MSNTTLPCGQYALDDESLDLLGGDSALDRPLSLTLFSNHHATRKDGKRLSLRDLAGAVSGKTAPEKGKLPMVKLGTFGDVITAQGSYRHSGNMLSVTGIEGDYDGESLNMAEGAERLREAGLAALLYTSASHTPERPRWRVLCPLAQPVSPDERRALVAALNGALGGVLASESFTASQAYYYGQVEGKHPVETLLIEGQPLDQVRGLTPVYPFANDNPSDQRGQGKGRTGKPLEVIASALMAIPNNGSADYEGTFKRYGLAMHEEGQGAQDYFEAFCQWAEQHPRFNWNRESERFEEGHGRKMCSSVWPRRKGKGTPDAIAGWSIIKDAIAHGWEMPPASDDDLGFEDVEDIGEFDDLLGRDAPGVADTRLDPRAELNVHHAVVSLGGKTAIMTVESDRVAFGTPADLKLRYQNRRHGKRTLAEAWLEWGGRREYPNGVVFRPDGRAPNGSYNLWRGWAAEPDESASCGLFLDHLRNIICNGDSRQYEWLLGWMAHMVQRPAEKPRSAIVLRGEKGAGKDIVGVYLRHLMDKSAYLHTSDQNAVWGQFNGPIANKLLIHLEEAFFHGDHGADSRIKNLITADSQTINEKHAPVYSIDSFHRLFITSNELRVVNATSGERRYFISEVSEARKGDHAYFNALVREMEGDGPAALMHKLLTYDLSAWNPRPPATEALLDAIAEGLKGVHAWMADCIDAEAIITADCSFLWRGEPIETDRLRNAFDGWASKPGNRYRTQETSASAFGKQIAPFLAKPRFRSGGRDGREWNYLLKTPDECRKTLDDIISKGNRP